MLLEKKIPVPSLYNFANMHLILNSSTGTLQVVTVAISTAPDGGFRESMCSHAIPAPIPHNMLRESQPKIVIMLRWNG